MERRWHVGCGCGWEHGEPVPLEQAKALAAAHEAQWPGDRTVIARWRSEKPVRDVPGIARRLTRR